jgi:hypothetical protein
VNKSVAKAPARVLRLEWGGGQLCNGAFVSVEHSTPLPKREASIVRPPPMLKRYSEVEARPRCSFHQS